MRPCIGGWTAQRPRQAGDFVPLSCDATLTDVMGGRDFCAGDDAHRPLGYGTAAPCPLFSTSGWPDARSSRIGCLLAIGVGRGRGISASNEPARLLVVFRDAVPGYGTTCPPVRLASSWEKGGILNLIELFAWRLCFFFFLFFSFLVLLISFSRFRS
ncbi:hypothetical protein LZ30DRAFT_701414 [Colletotrichum cereale]|nr:hypothetical protein LZ30DRAFT_701414 [Colletotrichum cereale]